MLDAPIVSISIDTEEDNWSSFSWLGATARNIGELPRLQELLDGWGARPTYLVGYAPLVSPSAVRTLGALAERTDVEIGIHCHPWNTPPRTDRDPCPSMMCQHDEVTNRDKVATVRDTIIRELGVAPVSFRAGRWGFGPTVAAAIAALDVCVDSSISPFIDWSPDGGPDYAGAPFTPYRFDPAEPLRPSPGGRLAELPMTIGFLGGRHERAGTLRALLERSWSARLHLVGALDRAGMLTKRWLSPEFSSAAEMIELVDALVGEDAPFLQISFHSCTLLAGATPFVRDADDLRRFLRSLEAVLEHLASLGCRFRTLREAAQVLTPAVAAGTR